MAALERGSTLLPSFGLRPALFVPLFDDDDPWGPSRYRLLKQQCLCMQCNGR